MLLNAQSLSKYHGPVAALTEATFTLDPGEILGVVGQRGAGKSTLARLLAGAELPTGGGILVDDQPVVLRNPRRAQALGIEVAHERPSLAGNLSVLANVFMGREVTRLPRAGMLLDTGDMLARARQILREFDFPPELFPAQAARLSGEQRHVVALARLLSRTARVLVVDSGLDALTYERQNALLRCLRQRAEQGAGVILIADDLKHIFSITQRILILHPDRPTTLRTTQDSDPREIVELIVGSNRRDQITPVIWAIENYHLAQRQAESLRSQQRELQLSLEAQDSLNRELIDRMRNQLGALDRLNLALQDAHQRLMTERETERKRLARELHDQVIQDLLSYSYQIEEVEDESDDLAQRAELLKIRTGLRQAIGNVREMCSDLRPPTIDRHGLSVAIRSLVEKWSAQTGIPIDLEIEDELGRMPEAMELSVYRIVQEGLANIKKHARATRVHLALSRSATASLVLRLTDNGKGLAGDIDLAALSQRRSFGLLGISERVSLMRGSVSFERPAGGGLDLRIELPSPYPSLTEVVAPSA